jgi:peptidyl-prolyl cis-trans isomerase A (cyclophilin A)
MPFRARSPLFVLSCLTLLACSKSDSAPPSPGADAAVDATTPTDPVPADDAGSSVDAPIDVTGADSAVDPLEGCTRDPGAPVIAVDAGAADDDPIGGADKFTLAQALAGFPTTSGALTAVIETEKSFIKCTLSEAEAPISVANFVGLARGTRPYRVGDNDWKVGRFYDGLIWHRVIPNFVIQGGDPLGDGTGGPGYDLPVENQVAEPLGTLAMASGDVPSGSQFYIVIGKGPAAQYNVFGKCSTEAAIAIGAVKRDADDKPKLAVHIAKVSIARCP